MIRLFAGLVIPDDIGEGLARRQHGIQGANWRPLDALHVTLRFAGDISETQGEDFASELAVVSGAPPTVTLSGVGYFGEGADIDCVWAGMDENPAVRLLASRCESAARRAGLKPDKRPYTPHVTLAYLRRPDPARVMDWIAEHNLLKSPPFTLKSFALFSSWPTSAGQMQSSCFKFAHLAISPLSHLSA